MDTKNEHEISMKKLDYTIFHEFFMMINFSGEREKLKLCPKNFYEYFRRGLVS